MEQSQPRGFADEFTPTQAELLSHVRVPDTKLLDAELQIRGKAGKSATAMGLHTIRDLVYHLPFRYEDRRHLTPLAELVAGEKSTVLGKVVEVKPRRNGRRLLVHMKLEDDSGTVRMTWFNRPWILKEIHEGDMLLVYGAYRNSQLQPEEYEVGIQQTSDSLTPVYPTTEGITSLKIRDLLAKNRDAIAGIEDPLPKALLTRLGMPDRRDALLGMHFPTSPEAAQEATRRLAFDELLLWELTLLDRRSQRNLEEASKIEIADDGLTTKWLREELPFELTGDQKKAIEVIDEDLASSLPMQRLLMGEVGAGKTLVALAAILRGIDAGYQGALLAPTETLAEQHNITLKKLLRELPVSVELLTGSVLGKKREAILEKLKSGELNIIVGTHALLQEPVDFNRLGVAIIDEQHRFGVRQRAVLDSKGPIDPESGKPQVPNVLHMSATPIPRSLAMALYGDLDRTVLKELPAERTPISTHIISTAKQKERMYERIREEIRGGRQVFVVCPLVEESDLLQAKAATQEYEDLKAGEFKDQRVLLIHGRMKSAEKQDVMARFAAKEADVLVATSVIEVGIDIPNASVILVENANRYGISQLHQLRGRVGRGEHASICFLAGPKSSPRLRALAENNDGFRLSELDLELRGQGEIMGVRQSGLSEFKVATLDDEELVAQAHEAATEILESPGGLAAPENLAIAAELSNTYGAVA